MLCFYCGKSIIGDPIGEGNVSELVYFDGDQETVILPAIKPRFCSKVCEWRWWLDQEKFLGMSGKEARRHLIRDHGLTPLA